MDQLGDTSDENRTRLSRPGLRAFRKIADKWRMSEADSIAVLGCSDRSTYLSWMRKAAADEEITLSRETLLRISLVLGIYKRLAMLFSEADQAYLWLSTTHRADVFADRSPLRVAVEDGEDGLVAVCRYVDNWCAGILPE